MRRVQFWLGLCIMVVMLGTGCGKAGENVDMKGGEMMSGELLQNSEEIAKMDSKVEAASVDEVHVEGLDISMTEVSDTLCPPRFSLKKAGIDYGQVTHFTYYSETTKCDRNANILLPGDYDESKKYPVLYFLHGIFGDENSMIKDANNKIDVILGNLKSEGLCEDIIVVFPDMYATVDPEIKPGFSAKQVEPYDNFINDLTNDLIPFIEKNYSVYEDKEHRGLVGFSMGGRETLYIGLMRSDLFDAIGAIAPAPGVVAAKDWAMEHPGLMEKDEVRFKEGNPLPKVFIVCCGTKDSVVGKFPLEYHEILKENAVEHLWYEVPDADHDSMAIRSGFYNFLVRWFLS